MLKKRSVVFWYLCALTLAGRLGATTPNQAPEQTAALQRHVVLSVQDASLQEFARQISELTGRRFILAAGDSEASFTVVSASAITRAEAYNVFLSVLRSHGLTSIRHGAFEKIVKARGVHQQPSPVLDRGSRTPAHERFYTRLYRLRFASADEVSKLLLKFKSRVGKVTPASAQLLILTDTGASIRRLLRLSEELDTERTDKSVWIEPVKHRSARKLARLFDRIYRFKDGDLQVLAEETTNSLIIIGDSQSHDSLSRQLARLDTNNLGGPWRIIRLSHANALEITDLLDTLLGGRRNRQSIGRLQSIGFEGDVDITPDEPTNSLLVKSSSHDFAKLQLTIAKLDQQRAQVFIEAVVMDVSGEESWERNLGAHGGLTSGTGPEATLVLGGFNARRSIAPNASELQALAIGVRGPELDVDGVVSGVPPGLSTPAFGAVLNAFAQDSSVKVLATPHLLILDNASAEIRIGENVPLQTGAPQSGGRAAFPPIVNIQRADVGTLIKVTPHINEENAVRLELEQEVSAAAGTQGQLQALTVTQRIAKTTVTVADQQTVVIGGLASTTHSVAQTKVPLLGDLPVLGSLFQSSQQKRRRTNLLLLLTPHVIRRQEDLRRVFQARVRERQQFLDRHFVFDRHWRAPGDFSRSVGLLERIRQSMAVGERRRQRRGRAEQGQGLSHPGSEPIDLAAPVESAQERAERLKRRRERRRRRRRRRKR